MFYDIILYYFKVLNINLPEFCFDLFGMKKSFKVFNLLHLDLLVVILIIDIYIVLNVYNYNSDMRHEHQLAMIKFVARALITV